MILTNAEMLQSTDFGPTLQWQFSQNILTMSHQMRDLVENLLELSRADNGLMKLPMAPLNLRQKILDASLLFEPVFFEKELTLEYHIEEDITVKANDRHMEQLISILLDNDRKYSYYRTTSSVLMQRLSKKYCLLSVTSHGDTISPQELKNLFKRFYRVDKARSREQSYGLGLSIAERIVKRHKGKIWCESVENRNTFYVLLPMRG